MEALGRVGVAHFHLWLRTATAACVFLFKLFLSLLTALVIRIPIRIRSLRVLFHAPWPLQDVGIIWPGTWVLFNSSK